MALSEIDRKLLQRCLHQEPHSWEDFVDRFVGLVVHVINHTARVRSIQLSGQDEEDLAAEFFLTVVQDDFAVLRRFRGSSSLATYLTVVARRVVVREMLKRTSGSLSMGVSGVADQLPDPSLGDVDEPLGSREEIEQLLAGLNGAEADVVRLHYLEGKSYREVSLALGIPENSVGPTLSRAREKMRQAVAGQ